MNPLIVSCLFVLIILMLFFTNKIMKTKSKILIITLIFIFQCFLFSCDENICFGFLGTYILFLIILFFLKIITRLSFYYSSKINEQKLKKILLYCVKNECYSNKFDLIIRNLLLFFLEQNQLYDNNYKFKEDDNFKNIKIENNQFNFKINLEKNVKPIQPQNDEQQTVDPLSKSTQKNIEEEKENEKFTLSYDINLNIDPNQKPLCIKGTLKKKLKNNKNNIYNCNNLEYEGNIKNFEYDDDMNDDKKKDRKIESQTNSIKKGKNFIVEGYFSNGQLQNNKIKINKKIEGYLSEDQLILTNNQTLNISKDVEKYPDNENNIGNKNWIMKED